MEKRKLQASWLKAEVEFYKEMTDLRHNPGHFNSLIKIVGLNPVLRFVDRAYLQKNGVDLTLTEELEDVVILEDE